MSDNHVKVSGAWKAIDDCSVKVSGAWKQVESIYVKVGGAWKTVWNSLVYTITGASIIGTSTGSSHYAGVRFNVDGTVDQHKGVTYTQISASTDWAIPNAHGLGNHYIRYTSLTGDALTGSIGAFSGGEDVWGELVSTAEVWVEDSNSGPAGSKTSTFTVEIATDSGGTNIVASGSYTLTADWDTS